MSSSKAVRFPACLLSQTVSGAASHGVSSCCSAGTCYNGDCEGLHLSVEERKQHAKWLAPEHQQVIIAAGESVVQHPKILAAANDLAEV